MTPKQLLAENEDLRARLDEAEETLRAIRNGEVDALIVSGVSGEQVFTLKGADHPYQMLIEEMSEGTLTLSGEGVILYANRRFAEMLNAPLEKVIGSKIHDWIALADHNIFQKLLRSGIDHKRREELSLVCSNGAWLPIYLSANRLFKDGESETFGLVATDLTEHKRGVAIAAAEKSARASLEQSERTRRVLLSMLEDQRQAQEALRASEAELRALFNAMHDVVLVYDNEGRYLKIAPTRPDLLIAAPNDLLGKTVYEVLPQAQANLFVEKIRVVLATQHTLEFEYSLPIADQIVWFQVTVSPLNQESVIWVAHNITNRKQHERELEAIAAVSAALRTAATRAEMLPVILDQLSNLLAADTIAFAMRDIVTGETVMESARGKFVGALRARLPAGEGVSGQVINSGKSYLNNDFQSETRFARSDIMGDTTAAACVPMIAGTEIIGAIWIGRTTPITDSDIHLLTAIAEIAASAIHRSTLHEEAQKQLERMAALRAIDMVIGSSFDLSITLNAFLNQVVSQLHVDAAAVLSHNAQTHLLEYVAGRGFQTHAVEKTRLRMGEGHAGRAVLERQTIRVPDLAREPLNRNTTLAAEKFVSCHAVPLIAKGEVKGVLEVFHRAPFTAEDSWLDFLETLAGQAAIAMDNAALFEDLQRRNVELAFAYDATIEGWSRALDLRDKETEGHTQRVTELTMRLAAAMGIADNDLLSIRRGALLHDIGKMGVPDSILLKPGPLDDAEWAIMRRHPQYAYEMLSSIPFLKDSLDIPYRHHEKWDGTGYPRGLKGEQIPLTARIFAIVDVWDALRSDRPYRQAWSEEKVREHIQSLSRTHFDPNVVEAFLRLK